MPSRFTLARSATFFSDWSATGARYLWPARKRRKDFGPTQNPAHTSSALFFLVRFVALFLINVRLVDSVACWLYHVGTSHHCPPFLGTGQSQASLLWIGQQKAKRPYTQCLLCIRQTTRLDYNFSRSTLTMNGGQIKLPCFGTTFCNVLLPYR